MSTYIVWPWRPLRGVTETLEWRTDIIEAYDGTEQRIQVRQEPRQSFEASFSLPGGLDLSRLQVALAAWQHRDWGWPCWHEESPLLSPLPAGGTSIQVDTASADFRVGGLAIIWGGTSDYDVVSVSGVSAGSLDLASPAVRSRPSGTPVMPLRMSRMKSKAKRDDSAVERSEYSVTVQVTDNTELATEASPVQYLGYDVLSDPLIMPGDRRPRNIERPTDVLDPGTGYWEHVSRMAYPRVSTDHKWVISSRAQAWAFRRWLHRRAGMLNPVWIPSRTHDLMLAAQPAAAATMIEIQDVNYRSLALSSPGMTHIAAFAPDGSFVCRQITGASAGSAGRENLSLSSALGFTNVAKVSFLALHRFSADRVTLAWDRVGVASCLATMVGVSE